MSCQKDSSDPLVGVNGQPLRLFTASGHPVTDVDGRILQNIAGDALARIDLTKRTFKDPHNRDLTDAAGRTPNQWQFDPTQPPEQECLTDCLDAYSQLFDSKGRPLTDKKRRPLSNRCGKLLLLFGPRGEPYCDIDGDRITDELGMPVQTRTVRLARSGKVLSVFDEHGRPLTDANGFVLLDISGRMLLIVDASLTSIVTERGSPIFDSSGLKATDNAFDLTRPPAERGTLSVVTVGDERALAFDYCGHPLTDFLGQVLYTRLGEPLVVRSNNTWVSPYGDATIVVKKVAYDAISRNGFRNSQGATISLFNQKGWPLTDINGTPLFHASGKLLVCLNFDMHPVADWLGGDLFDRYGAIWNSSKIEVEKFVGDSNERLTVGRLFNKCGYPVSNADGLVLLNPKMEPLVILNDCQKPYRDIDGGAIFDSYGLPIGGGIQSGSLKGPNQSPLRLYDSNGLPTTDSKGRVLNTISGRPLLTADDRGRLKCSDDQTIHDKNKNPYCSLSFDGTIASDRVSDKLISSNGKPLCLYDQSGRPLTDVDGNILHRDNDRPLVICHPSRSITTDDGKSAFDVSGNQCYRCDAPDIRKPVIYFDKTGRPLTDQFGDVLLTKAGETMLKYQRWRPKLCLNGRNVVASSQLRESHLVSLDLQLFDVENLPVTDTIGDLLYNLEGRALLNLNSSGKVVSDFLGRPVFDINGLPISKCSGCWKGPKMRPLRLFNAEGLPLTDENGFPLCTIDGQELIRDDKSGRPLFDLDYQPVRDSRGKCVFSAQFKPIARRDPKTVKLLDLDNSGLRVFNKSGWPLSSQAGHVLVDSNGRKLIKVKKDSDKMTDRNGNTVFDALRRPFGCDALRPLIGIDSKPYLLFGKDGTPLTSSDGTPLALNGGACAVKFDVYGRPVDAAEGGGIYDSSATCIIKCYGL